jgi:hypothetical protein
LCLDNVVILIYNRDMAKKSLKGKNPTTIRLTELGEQLLTKLATKIGVSKAAIIEMAIREKAEKEGVIHLPTGQ